MNITISWEEFSIVTALIVFIGYIVVDGMYAYYTIQITKRKAVHAATISGVMHFLLAFGVLNYVQNFLYVIPLALGSWVGTYLIVRHHKNQEQRVTEVVDHRES